VVQHRPGRHRPEVWIQLIEHVDRIREPLALLGWLNVVRDDWRDISGNEVGG
jgi:hypothetical protein